MTSRRILASVATAAVSLSMMQPVFAAAVSTDEVLAELKSFDPDTICEGRTNKDLGRCIGDVIKRLAGLRNDFNQALQAERKVWFAENGNMGISAESSSRLQEYLKGVKAKRDEFTRLRRELEQSFFAARKQVLESASSGTGSFTRRVNSSDMDEATAKCAKQSDKSGLRICLRQQLRLRNQTSRLLNVTPSGVRNTQ